MVSLSLSFMILTLWKNAIFPFNRMFLILGLSAIPSLLDMGFAFLAGRLHKCSCVLLSVTQEAHNVHLLLLGDFV